MVSDLSASPLDPSQFGIIEDINTRNHVVVHGPPGTGKSQTITGIITSALANDLKVAVVCQKAAAIDVLIQNLGELGVDKEVLVTERLLLKKHEPWKTLVFLEGWLKRLRLLP